MDDFSLWYALGTAILPALQHCVNYLHHSRRLFKNKTQHQNLVEDTSAGGVELGGKVEGVDGSGVAQVVLKVLQGSLACHNSLDEESKHGEHSLHNHRTHTSGP